MTSFLLLLWLLHLRHRQQLPGPFDKVYELAQYYLYLKQVPQGQAALEKAEFSSGIMVLPVEYTKGLEFDAVLILDPTREEYPVDDGHAKKE